MAGLLDFLDSDQARLGMGLLAAAGPTMEPTSFGQRLFGAMQMYRGGKQADEERALKKALVEAQTQNYLGEAADRTSQAKTREAALKQNELLSQRLAQIGSGGDAQPVNFSSSSQPPLTMPLSGAQVPNQQQPSNPVFAQQQRLFQIAQVYDQLGRSEEAKRYYDAADKLTPKVDEIYNSQGAQQKGYMGPNGWVNLGGAKQDQAPWQYQGGQVNPLWLGTELQLRTAQAPRVINSITQQQESEESKTVGKGFGDQYVAMQNSAMKAPGAIAKLQNFQNLLEGVNTGKLTPMGTELAAYAKAVGINVDPKLGNKQAAEAISNQMALDARSTAEGTGMPGAMSDQDRNFLKQIVASIGKDPEANRVLIEAQKKLLQRQIEVARLARDYRKKNGHIDEGFYNEAQGYADNNPLFPQAAQGGSRLRFNPQTGQLE